MVSEIGRLVYGSGAVGSVLYGCLQAATALILILAANTSFTGFPFLVSFVAEDSFLPRPADCPGAPAGVLQRDHRAGGGLDRPAGRHPGPGRRPHPDVRHRRVHRVHHGRRGHDQAPPAHREPGWRRSVAVNATAAVVCLLVVLIFSITEFTKGAWVVVVVMPS